MISHTPESLKKVVEKEKLNWRSFADGKAISQQWNSPATPAFFLIDDQGVIRRKWIGHPGEEAIDTHVEKLLSEVNRQAKGEVNLGERYPTDLVRGDTKNPRPWTFRETDIFRLAEFDFTAGSKLTAKSGVADLGIGHCDNGAVCAVVIPRAAGTLLSGDGKKNREEFTHLWLRFHPAKLNRIFPPDTVFSDGNRDLILRMKRIARAKFSSSWHYGSMALIPGPGEMTADFGTVKEIRRFFQVETRAGAENAIYHDDFETRTVTELQPFSAELAGKAFDQLWNAFDRDYAMFGLRPEVDWNEMKKIYRPRAVNAGSTDQLAAVLAEMLGSLRDLHAWLEVAGHRIPVFSRPGPVNFNPAATGKILGKLNREGRRIQWTVTSDHIGYIAVSGWDDREIPDQFGNALEEMRKTRGLIIDVRANGGGSELLAGNVAARFVERDFIYAFSQFRDGPDHSDLTKKHPRKVQPRGPWRYDRPVTLLIGRKCMSSTESFIAMMSGAKNVTTMGDRTRGSSGNPKVVDLPLEMKAGVPRWIDYLPDGSVLDEKGIRPQIQFDPRPGAFSGDRDDLLSEAVARLREADLPSDPIAGPSNHDEEARLPDYAKVIEKQASDPEIAKVISVHPEPGSDEVDPNTEIRIRFDRPMDAMATKLTWNAGGYSRADFPEYDPDTDEFRISASLAQGSLHQLVVNQFVIEDRPEMFPYEGFQSAEGKRAGVYAWKFRTKKAAPDNPIAQPSTDKSQSGPKFRGFNSADAAFLWKQGGDFIRANVTKLMWTTHFEIGCREGQWWFFSDRHKRLVLCSGSEMHIKDIAICDPFGLTESTPEEVVAKQKLTYLGNGVIEGSVSGGPRVRWEIDPSNFLLRRWVKPDESRVAHKRSGNPKFET